MSNKLKAIDCQELIATLESENELLKMLGIDIPQTYTVEAFSQAFAELYPDEESGPLFTRAGDLTKGLLDTRDEMKADGLI
jgi:hypothetical protein